MNRRFLTVLGASAALALVVAALFYQMTTSASRPRRGKVETKDVVVATNPVPLGGVLKSTDLKIVAWPADNVPPGAFSKIDEVVERVAMSNILVEEPVLEGRLAAKGSGLGLSPIIPPGMRAVSVRVNDVISVAGFVLPGSRVDVLVTGVPRAGGGEAGPVTRTILSNIQVLSAGKNIQPDAKGQPENVPVVTLLVTPEQGEILTLASSEGKIQLALRNNTDDQRTSGNGTRAAEIFAGPVKAPEARPKPRPRAVVPVAKIAAPPEAARIAPPPPPPQIELIRGDKKSVEPVQTIYR
jgi:pilus assembly protein CpaB